MVKRSLQICMRTLLGVIALCVILAGLASWRLSQGPVKLDFLTPYLASTMSTGLQDAAIEIGETVLIWADWSRAIDVRLRDVKLINNNGLPLISLPELSVNLSAHGLLFGQIALSKVEAFGASVTLIRKQGGGFDFQSYGLEEESETIGPERPADLSLVLPTLLKELTAAPRSDDPLSFLNTLRVVDGSLFVIDRAMNSIWHAPSATISIQRLSDGLAARAWLNFGEVDEGRDELELSLFYQASQQAIELEANLAGLHPPSMGLFGDQLAPLSGLDLPFQGTIQASLGANGSLRALDFDIDAIPGRLTLPEVLPQTLAVHDLVVEGQWDSETATLNLEQAKLAISRDYQADPDESPELTVKGQAKLEAEGLRIAFDSQVERVPAEDLEYYWPTVLADGAREWVVENITGGRADRAELSASLWMPAEDPGALAVESLSGNYSYSDLVVHYRKPLPPATGISGTATFDQAGMSFAPGTAKVGDLSIEQAAIEITGLDQEDQAIDIDLSVVGSLRDALTLLNHESLGLISDLGVDPRQTSGAAKAEVSFSMPLIEDLEFDDVRVEAKAGVRNLVLKDAALERDVSEGEVKLDLSNEGMTITGPVVFGGIPIQLRWDETFQAEAPVQSVFFVEFDRLDQKDLESFGLGVSDFMDGKLGGWLELKLDSERSGTMGLSVDLSASRLTLSHLNWVKPLNVPGRLKAVLGLREERFTNLEISELRAGTLSGSGQGLFRDDGQALKRLALSDVRLDRNALESVNFVWEGESTTIELGRGRLDAEPFLNAVDEESREDEPSERGLAAPDLVVSAPYLDSVRFGESREVQNVAFHMERRGGDWQRLSIKGQVPEALWTVMPKAEAAPKRKNAKVQTGQTAELDEGAVETQSADQADLAEAEEMGPNEEKRSFSLDYGPVTEGRFPLRVKADDVGGLLKAFNLNDTIKGGRLSIKGGSAGPIPQHSLEGKIRVEDFVLVDTPVLARLLTVASLTGLSDTLSGKGIRFERLKGRFSLNDGVAHTKLLRAYGPALGITSQGQIDFDRAEVDLEGTIVPAYSVNQLLEKIPLVGALLTGGEGEGLFAVLYSTSGPLTDPVVSVNPLSLLTPGFLRSIFGRPGGDAPSVFPPGPVK